MLLTVCNRLFFDKIENDDLFQFVQMKKESIDLNLIAVLRPVFCLRPALE